MGNLTQWYDAEKTALSEEERRRRQSVLGESALANKYIQQALKKQGIATTGGALTTQLQSQTNLFNQLGVVGSDIGARRSDLESLYATKQSAEQERTQSNAFTLATELLGTAETEQDVTDLLTRYSAELSPEQKATLETYAGQTVKGLKANEQATNLEFDIADPTTSKTFEYIDNYDRYKNKPEYYKLANDFIQENIANGRYNPNNPTIKMILAKLQRWASLLPAEQVGTKTPSPVAQDVSEQGGLETLYG